MITIYRRFQRKFLMFIIICLCVRYSVADVDPKLDLQDTETLGSENDHIEEKFEIPEEPTQTKNWTELMRNTTSCEEFLNTTFDASKIIDIEWKIWYYWNQEFEESYTVKFSIPSKVLVDRFRVELDEEITPKVNWNDSVLFMEASIDFSALFIKTKLDGQFRVIPTLAFEYARLPELIFGIKLIEPPGYLALLNCKYRMCYAMAPIDKMPYYQTYDEEAKKIGFRSNLGRSHIAISPSPPPMPHDFDDHELHEDDRDELHLEIEQQYKANLDTILL